MKVAVTATVRADYVPSSFEDMFSHYYEYVVNLVRQSGIDTQNAEDVAQAILTKFFEKDALSDFNPEFTSRYDGITRKAVFKTFLSGFVKAYVRHYVDRQRILRRREGFSPDTVLFIYSETGDAATWMDLEGPTTEDQHEELESEDTFRTIREHLATVPARNIQDQCDMPAFFDAVLAQTNAEGRVDTAELSAQFGVSKTSIQNWLKRLRTEVAKVVEV